MCLCVRLSSSILLQLTSLFVKTSRSNELKVKLRELQNQISSINMVDEFPTYARVERKLKALNAELAEISKWYE